MILKAGARKKCNGCNSDSEVLVSIHLKTNIIGTFPLFRATFRQFASGDAISGKEKDVDEDFEFLIDLASTHS